MDKRTNVPTPVSGERVMMPNAKGKLSKPAQVSDNDLESMVDARQRRRDWEATPAGQARTTSFHDRTATDGISTGQRYMINNYDVKPDVGPRVYDRQLPGMADPHAAPRPPKWEELTSEQRSHTQRALALRGTDIETMKRDIGAQLDQAHQRAWSHEGAIPYASDFYENGEPRRVLDSSAKELGIPPQIHAMANAFTSPNTKFSQRRADGSTTYPNDEAARHAVRAAQQGIPADEVTNELSTTGSGTKRAQGYVTNIRKAVSAVHQFLGGREPADWEFGPSGRGGFDASPKTGPYANSWSDSHPQYTVADVHTGGGGAFPHLGSEKSVLYDDQGEVRRDASSGKEKRGKSEREEAIERVPFAHAAIDHAMRGAMAERGLGSVRRAQAAQWGEEQIQRGEGGLRGAPRAADVYGDKGSSPAHSPQFSDGSQQLALGFTQQARADNNLAQRKEIAKRARDEDF